MMLELLFVYVGLVHLEIGESWFFLQTFHLRQQIRVLVFWKLTPYSIAIPKGRLQDHLNHFRKWSWIMDGMVAPAVESKRRHSLAIQRWQVASSDRRSCAEGVHALSWSWQLKKLKKLNIQKLEFDCLKKLELPAMGSGNGTWRK